MPQTLTIQTASNGFMMQKDQPTSNYSANQSLNVGLDGTDEYRGVCRFDFAALPSRAIILEAALGLHAFGGVARTLDIKRCLQDVILSQFTWNIYKTASNWNTAGAKGAESDYTDTYATTLTWVSDDWAYCDVTDMAVYAQANLSKILRLVISYPGAGTTYATFCSSYHSADISLRPKLTITYKFSSRNGIKIF